MALLLESSIRRRQCFAYDTAFASWACKRRIRISLSMGTSVLCHAPQFRYFHRLDPKHRSQSRPWQASPCLQALTGRIGAGKRNNCEQPPVSTNRQTAWGRMAIGVHTLSLGAPRRRFASGQVLGAAWLRMGHRSTSWKMDHQKYAFRKQT